MSKIYLALDNRVLRESIARLLRNGGKGCMDVCGISPCTSHSAESVAAFVLSVRHGAPPLVRPQEARRALQTALLIDDAADHGPDARAREAYVAVAAAR